MITDELAVGIMFHINDLTDLSSRRCWHQRRAACVAGDASGSGARKTSEHPHASRTGIAEPTPLRSNPGVAEMPMFPVVRPAYPCAPSRIYTRQTGSRLLFRGC
jgi:hypothetical protein